MTFVHCSHNVQWRQFTLADLSVSMLGQEMRRMCGQPERLLFGRPLIACPFLRLMCATTTPRPSVSFSPHRFLPKKQHLSLLYDVREVTSVCCELLSCVLLFVHSFLLAYVHSTLYKRQSDNPNTTLLALTDILFEYNT